MAEVYRVTRVLVTGARAASDATFFPCSWQRGWDVQAVSTRALRRPRGDVTLAPGEPASIRSRHVASCDGPRPPTCCTSPGTSRPVSGPPHEESYKWVQASVELLRAFEAAGGQRIVGAGSCLEYDWSYGVCAEARTPCVPHTGYGACKHAAQQLLSS